VAAGTTLNSPGKACWSIKNTFPSAQYTLRASPVHVDFTAAILECQHGKRSLGGGDRVFANERVRARRLAMDVVVRIDRHGG
jgi:hypothetical protein